MLNSLPDGALKRGENFIEPILSPTMAGGLFAIEREYFFDIGEYVVFFCTEFIQ